MSLRTRRGGSQRGLEGPFDAPRSGAPLTHGPATRALLIGKACTRPESTAEGARRERWTYEQLRAEVGMPSTPSARDPVAGGHQAAPDPKYWISTE
jgi:hypothetical protein